MSLEFVSWNHLWAIAAVSGALACSTPSFAESTWDAGGDGLNWNDAANWNPDGVPGSTTDVLLDSGVTVLLDIAGMTLDLTMDDATIDGPGDLDVGGHLHWGAGRIEGAGTLSIAGGLTFQEGPNKVIGRQVEVMSDAWFEHSTIFYDIDNGGAIHYHAGTTLTIVDEAMARDEGRRRPTAFASYATPSGRRIRSGHLEVPLITDNTADNTDVFVTVVDGQVISNSNIERDVSTRINGTYVQNASSNTFDSGSRFGPNSNYVLGNGAEALFGRGTHVGEGVITEENEGMATGVRTLGDQTSFEFRPGFGAFVPIRTAGFHNIMTAVSFGSLSVVDGLPTVLNSPNLEFPIYVDNVDIDRLFRISAPFGAGSVTLRDADISLENGGSLDADKFTVNQSTGGRVIDADPGDVEVLRIREFLAEETGLPPMRIFPEVELTGPSLFDDDTEIEFMSDILTDGLVILNPGAIWRQRAGKLSLGANFRARVNGLSSVFSIGRLGSVFWSEENRRSFVGRMAVQGQMTTTGDNDQPEMTLELDGADVDGDGDLTVSRVELNPEDGVFRTTINGPNLYVIDYAAWSNGHIDLSSGSAFTIMEGAELVCNQSNQNLQFTDDGDPAEQEEFVVDGTWTIDQTTGTGINLDVPTTVNGTWYSLPHTKTTARDPVTINGTLSLHDPAEIRFLFDTSTVTETGVISGDGTVVEFLGGDLDVDGLIYPGTNGGILNWAGDLDMSAPTANLWVDLPFGQPPMDVSGVWFLPPTVDLLYGVPPEAGEEDHTLATAGSIDGVVQTVNVEGAATTATVEEIGNELVAHATTSANASSVGGTLFVDFDGDGVVEPEEPRLQLSDLILYAAGEAVTFTTSDDAGHYVFHGEYDGAYEVAPESVPGSLLITDPPTGFHDVLLFPGESIEDADFTYSFLTADFTVTTPDDSGPGSLRQILQDINDDPQNVTFVIDLTGAGGSPLMPLTPLPRISSRVRIIGGAPPSFAGGGATTVLDGSLCGDCDGLVLGGGESLVEGLTIQNFEGYGLVLEDLGGNFILESQVVANGEGGVLVHSGSDNYIGAGSNEGPNVITGNGGPGITILDGDGHELRRNEIHANAGQAVDLKGDGVTINDFRDLDGGPNGLQNTPELTDQGPLGLTVSGTLESRPAMEYVVEIYGSEACPESGTAELQQFLGAGTVLTDVEGLAAFSIDTTPYAGELSAIAIDPNGSTSEVSGCFTSVVTEVEDGGQVSAFVYWAGPNPTVGPTRITFSLPAAETVEASIHDVSGRRVRTLLSDDLDAGWHEIRWDGSSDRGPKVANGIYFYQLKAGASTGQGRIVKVR